MKVPGRPFLALFVLLMPVLVMLTAAAVWLAGCVADLSSAASAYAKHRAQRRWLQDRAERTSRRVGAKLEVLERLGRGRLTLRQAAARFSELHRADPNFPWKQFYRVHSGNTDEERHCRAVMVQVREHLTIYPGLAAVLPRLEDELRQLVRNNTGGELRETTNDE
jgi:hypothetical protein